MSSLQGRVAIVTGSSSGIGQSIAKQLAADGANIVINYIGASDGAQETLKMVEAAGAEGVTIKADVSKVSEAQSLIDEAWKKFGFADILVNNAGVETKTFFLETKEEDFDRIMGVNLKGPFFVSQAFVRKMAAEQKPGRIINISSVHEDMAFPGFATYCISKGGLRMLMRNLAVELGPIGITINNIAPGAIATPINKSLLEDKPKLNALLKQIPLNRLGSPADVAALVSYLASDAASYVTGATYYVDGGLSRYYNEQ
ncbi:MAG TPA: glucose 1-dehydrogenase [Alloacidobacterium sp.]|nr:glucose 1-dehydrogenase [Alloacidobacterium sp.]